MDPTNSTAGGPDLRSLLHLLLQSTASIPNSQSLFSPSVSGAQTPFSALRSPGGAMPSDVMQLLAVLQQSAQQPANPSAVHPSSSQRSASTLDSLAGALPDDEDILVNNLLARKMRGWSVRQALEALHGVNHHTAGSWKDYFLENHDRLSHRVAVVNSQAENVPPTYHEVSPPRGRTVLKYEKPVNASRTTSRGRRHSPSHQKPTASSQRSQSRGRPQSRVRQRVRFSETPSRSPTPPPKPDVPMTGRRYTDAESDYFFKSVRRQLSKDPYVTYNRMARVLAEKAPECGRSVKAWRVFLTVGQRDEVDRLIARARGKIPGRTSKAVAILPREEEEDQSSEDEVSKQNNARDRSISDGSGTEDDAMSMGAAGQPLTDADYRMAARYIASKDPGDWAASLKTARWTEFAQKHPQRNDAAWAQNYLVHREAIDELVTRYRRQYARGRGNEASPQRRGADDEPKVQRPPAGVGSKRGRDEPELIDVDDEETAVALKRLRCAP